MSTADEVGTAGPSPWPPAERPGTWGWVSLVIGIVVVGVGLVQQVVAVLIPTLMNRLAMSISEVSAVLAVFVVIVTVVAAVGLGFGIVGVQPGRARRLYAAAGLALCASRLIGGLVGLFSPVLVSALLS